MKEVHDNHCQRNSRFLLRENTFLMVIFEQIDSQTRQPIGRVKFDLKHLQSVAYSSRLILLHIFLKCRVFLQI